MSRAEELWERLVRAALRRERFGMGSVGHAAGGIAGYVPSSLNNRDIDTILRVADEIQDEEPNVARILCEHAYSLAQNLDPNSEGRGVLQFKTGLMSVIKQKLAKREVGTIDRSQDVARLLEFYRLYREKNNVDKLREEEMMLRESGVFSGNLGECAFHLFSLLSLCPFGCWSLEASMLGTLVGAEDIEKEKGFWNAKSIGDGIGAVDRGNTCRAAISFEQLKRVIDSDAAMTEDLIAYNIIPFPLDAPTITNAIVSFPEVRAAVSALKHYSSLPKLPSDFSIPETRSPDLMDFLHYVFGFQVMWKLSASYCPLVHMSKYNQPPRGYRLEQCVGLKDNVSNQREHVVLLLANEQSRHGIPEEPEPKLDEAAVQKVFLKSLDNYIKWCNYLCIQPVWSNLDAVNKEKKILFVSLYFLIWGEAANIRFLPECLCYIFHHMAREMDEALRQHIAQPANSCSKDGVVSFLDQVITPLYDVVAAGGAICPCLLLCSVLSKANYVLPPLCLVEYLRPLWAKNLHNLLEAANNENGRAPHSAWRNYDDFNEYFWSLHCFDLSWPWRKTSFFQKPEPRSKNPLKLGGGQHRGKTSFVEHRTFFHLYHSFHRLWIFLVMMFQGLTIIAFNDGHLNAKTLREVLSLGPTFVVMKFTESIYGGIHFFISFLMRIPACHRLTELCDNLSLIRFIKWMRQERYYVGRGMYERTTDFIKYMIFWLIILSGKFAFAYFFQIKPLVKPTRTVITMDNIEYSWHDFVSRSTEMELLFMPKNTGKLPLVQWPLFLLASKIFLAKDIAAESRDSQDELWERISRDEYMKYAVQECYYALRYILTAILEAEGRTWVERIYEGIEASITKKTISDDFQLNKLQLFFCLYASVLYYDGKAWLKKLTLERLVRLVQPATNHLSGSVLFKELRNISLIADNHNALTVVCLWAPVIAMYLLDIYIFYTVLSAVWGFLLGARDRLGEIRSLDAVQKLFEEFPDAFMKRLHPVRASASSSSEVVEKSKFDAARFSPFWNEIIKNLREEDYLTNNQAEKPEHEKGAVNAVQDLYDVVRHDVLAIYLREHSDQWQSILKARTEGRLFAKLNWPRDPELKAQVKRLYSLLTIKDSASNVPKNLEARRRLEFFTNSLFMDMPPARPVQEMLSFSVFTPYYSEIVLYSMNELLKKNEDGISILFYLQKIYPDEWKNFLARIGRDENAAETELYDSPSDILELRFWASYRGQTLARTVRGMMYYRKALMLQTYLERENARDTEAALSRLETTDTQGYELSPEARARADLKFTYVVTCQIYGRQKEEQKPEAADIALLMQRNEALRVAFIDVVETLKDGKVHTEYYSKLVKADINGKDKKMIMSSLHLETWNLGFIIGKYVEVAEVMRRNIYILFFQDTRSTYKKAKPWVNGGVNYHIQEIYAIKLPGDPKLGEGKPENQNHAIVFTRGNAVQTIDMNQDNYFEEALKVRNLLEEFDHIPYNKGWYQQGFSYYKHKRRYLCRYTRFNSTLRQGNITHHEYIQVGKGRDVGLNQIALFEGKVAGGNGEQVLSRDVYRLGQLFDFFRMMSFYFTTVGFYFCTMLTVLTIYIFLYGRAYLALSGVGETMQERARIMDNAALEAALNTQFLFQIGIFSAVPMVLGFILEQGFLRAIVSFITMQLQLCTVFFTFSLGTRTHYFGRTILHGGARYQATGRGFVVRHIKFSENYRLYSRSHFVKGLEVVLLLVVYLAYGYNDSALSYILLSISSWFMALSWLFAPYLFNPSGFEWQKIVEDFRDWTNWLFYRGGIGVKGEESWEAWWDEEMAHIRTMRGRIFETILSLRFFLFQYGIVYKLNVQGTNTSLTVYGFSWVVLAVLIILFKVFTFSQKMSVNFQLLLRFIQGVSFMIAIAGVAVAVALTDLSIPDIFASILAFVPTGWGILSIAAAWKPLVKKTGLWKSVRSMARLYDAGMGMIIFVPVAFFSWFPFVSTFQTRLMFNQAFSRGLEISLILAGNNPNTGL
ncbi:hypothetical protein GOBAR_DD14993 [Gossypium barbadense]|nr:hypothetical protein GOBAR_DD14993 [Gossypium barbadense]